MKACEIHSNCVVVYDGDDCPLCKGQKTIKTMWEELEKSMTVLKEIKKSGEEVGFNLKKDVTPSRAWEGLSPGPPPTLPRV